MHVYLEEEKNIQKFNDIFLEKHQLLNRFQAEMCPYYLQE